MLLNVKVEKQNYILWRIRNGTDCPVLFYAHFSDWIDASRGRIHYSYLDYVLFPVLAFFAVITVYGIYRNQQEKQDCERPVSPKAEL